MGCEVETSSFVVNIRPEPGGAEIAASSMDLHIDLRGTIEILHGDAFLTLGQFEDAIFLFSDLANIADKVARLRDGAPAVEVVLLESPQIYLSRRRRAPSTIDLRYGQETLKAIALEHLDAGFAAATKEFFEWVQSLRPTKALDPPTILEIDVIASVWSEVEPIAREFRRRKRLT